MIKEKTWTTIKLGKCTIRDAYELQWRQMRIFIDAWTLAIKEEYDL